jgi:hypothetical protein
LCCAMEEEEGKQKLSKKKKREGDGEWGERERK